MKAKATATETETETENSKTAKFENKNERTDTIPRKWFAHTLTSTHHMNDRDRNFNGAMAGKREEDRKKTICVDFKKMIFGWSVTERAREKKRHIHTLQLKQTHSQTSELFCNLV